MGWTSVEGEIAKRKVVFWGRLLRMGSDRWPKKILKMILESEYESEWYRETRKATYLLGDTIAEINENNWKNKVYTKWRILEGTKWEKEKNEHPKMGNYSTQDRWRRQDFLDGSRESITLCKYRIGDIGEIEDKFEEKWICHRCQGICDSLVYHILTECIWLQKERWDTGLEHKKRLKQRAGTPEVEIIKDIVGDTSKEQQLMMQRIHDKWKRKK